MRVLPVTHTSSHGRIDLFQQRGPLSELLDIHAAVLRRPGKFRIRLLRLRGRVSAPCLPAVCLPAFLLLHPFIFSAGVAASSVTDQQQWGRSMVSLGRHAGTPEGSTWGVIAPPA
jgi:hypothetical protein